MLAAVGDPWVVHNNVEHNSSGSSVAVRHGIASVEDPFVTTNSDEHHELPLLVVGPPHGEELFNRSGIFKTQLEDSVENEASNPSFAVSSR